MCSRPQGCIAWQAVGDELKRQGFWTHTVSCSQSAVICTSFVPNNQEACDCVNTKTLPHLLLVAAAAAAPALAAAGAMPVQRLQSQEDNSDNSNMVLSVSGWLAWCKSRNSMYKPPLVHATAKATAMPAHQPRQLGLPTTTPALTRQAHEGKARRC